MKKWLPILGTLVAIAALVSVGAFGVFSDTETSTDNTFTAGSLDLTLDGKNGENVVIFPTVFNTGNMKPGNQPRHQYILENVGTIPGYLDLEGISVTSYENNCVEPEVEAGDVTCGDPGEGEGELQDVLAFDLYWDNDCNGWWSTGDEYIYDGGYSGGIAASYDTNKLLGAGETECVVAIFNWWNTPDDNKAMTDSFELDIIFELGQTTSQ